MDADCGAVPAVERAKALEVAAELSKTRSDYTYKRGTLASRSGDELFGQFCQADLWLIVQV
jgi:hypothetical protein